MPASIYDQPISETEYLKFEESAPEKHEYVGGRVFAMSGSTAGHNLIIGNLYYALRPQAKRAGCIAFMNDMRVKVESIGNFYYPDLVVTCEQLHREAVFLNAPCLIVEVLSKSTMKIDRQKKLIAYRAIPSLKEYLLIDQSKRHLELYHKDANGDWLHQFYSGSQKLPLNFSDAPIDVELDAIYDGISV